MALQELYASLQSEESFEALTEWYHTATAWKEANGESDSSAVEVLVEEDVEDAHKGKRLSNHGSAVYICVVPRCLRRDYCSFT